MDKRELEMEQLRLELAMKRMNEQERLFAQKLEILKEAYVQLNKDQKKLEWEKLKFRNEKEQYSYENPSSGQAEGPMYEGSVFFRGCTNVLALKKRYRDLLKIFHTDNMYGDKLSMQRINEEYEKKKKEFEPLWKKSAE